MLGLRGLKAKETHSSAFVAAVSAWIHLGSLVKSICSVDIPERFSKAGDLLKPLLKEFQTVLAKEGLRSQSPDVSQSSDVSLTPLASIISFFYGTDIDSKKDVVMIWNAIRRVLNLEVNSDREIKTDLFSSAPLLMQPDPFNSEGLNSSEAKFPSQSKDLPDEKELDSEPATVQEAINHAFQQRSKAFRLWSQSSSTGDMPAILQIELHRQKYNQDSRKWKKLTHKIAMNETVDCNGHQYTLYGMIVHRGGLDFSEFFSVLRPEGPGTRWLKYAGDSTSRAVEVLTTKQAVGDHEGGSSEESAAVAYIAIYVRTDQVSQVLSPSVRKEILRKAQEEAKGTASEPEKAKMPKATPFRVGKRDWCAAFPTENMYDSIRECHGSHLNRSFYRTEYKPDVLKENADSQVTEEPEKTEDPEKIEEQKIAEASEKTEEVQKAVPKDPLTQQVNVFVKRFDNEKQELVDFGTVKASGAMHIVQHLKEQLGIDNDESWDFYHEHTITIRSKNLISRSKMFFDLSYGNEPWDGILIIAQRRPTKEQYVRLVPTFLAKL